MGKCALFLLNRGNVTCTAPVQTRCYKGLLTTYGCDGRTSEADTVSASNTQEEKRFF